ncbi:hypothetical protein [Magnetococcus marinus]|uniref:hypothetical protein n=1 Tax=Magnetococcus marinus TaxID=1124597 RepID=UPI00135F160D|nr:hypothetical protein [Magnetococcus marinus]
MTFIDQLRSAVFDKKVPEIFSSSDITNAGIPDPNNNLSNYDKKNKGTPNNKVLISR